MAPNTVLRSVLVAVVVVLLFAALLVPTAAAVVASTPASSSAQRRQNFYSFAAYAERVGAALELLVRGYDSNDEDEIRSVANEFVEDSLFNPSAGQIPIQGADPTSPLAYMTQYLQHSQSVVRSAIRSVTGCARALRTLTYVVIGAPLDNETDTLLAQVKADSSHSAEMGGFMSPHLAPLKNELMSHAAIHSIATNTSYITASQPPQTSDNVRHRQAETLASRAAALTPVSCSLGLNAYSSDVIIACSGTPQQYTTAEYMALSAAQQKQCSGTITGDPKTSQTCVCPRDFFLLQTRGGYTCQSRPLDVEVSLENKYPCVSEDDVALGLPGTVEGEYCIQTTRNSTLEFSVTWKYAFLSNDAIMAATVQDMLTTPPEVPPNANTLRWVVMVDSVLFMGTYSELGINEELFQFIVAGYAGSGQRPPSPGDAGFYLSMNTPLWDSSAFSAVFCFASPRKTQNQMKEVKLDSLDLLREYLGNANGISSHSLTLDLSAVPDDFLEGNQMYVETGIKTNLFIYPHRVARIHISFTDLPEPPANSHRYHRQFNPLYILLIAAIGVVSVGTASAVLWYYCMQQDDYDDRLVSDAQQKKKQRQGSGTN
ncbi:hypothetical protein JKF63_06913 [Porcisia hertigi]|uniref:Uncharacterized protein n=1 Tax=Porcisia hertigi TaxID=2761500 RepID=A0A836YG10_9TRYP|nr:hypothetical protein JKF63_06913 [Porcisia hertigi]